MNTRDTLATVAHLTVLAAGLAFVYGRIQTGGIKKDGMTLVVPDTYYSRRPSGRMALTENAGVPQAQGIGPVGVLDTFRFPTY